MSKIIKFPKAEMARFLHPLLSKSKVEIANLLWDCRNSRKFMRYEIAGYKNHIQNLEMKIKRLEHKIEYLKGNRK